MPHSVCGREVNSMHEGPSVVLVVINMLILLALPFFNGYTKTADVTPTSCWLIHIFWWHHDVTSPRTLLTTLDSDWFVHLRSVTCSVLVNGLNAHIVVLAGGHVFQFAFCDAGRQGRESRPDFAACLFLFQSVMDDGSSSHIDGWVPLYRTWSRSLVRDPKFPGCHGTGFVWRSKDAGYIFISQWWMNGWMNVWMNESNICTVVMWIPDLLSWMMVLSENMG